MLLSDDLYFIFQEEQERQAQALQQRGQKNLGSSVWSKFKL